MDAVAVTAGGRQLTYAELDRRANALADRLRAAGVTRGTIVGLYVERDLEMAIAVLGILKAGGAYLPIDGAYPDERAAFMLEDSGAALLVSQRSLATALPGVTAVTRIFVDDEHADASPDHTPLSPAVGPDDVAYVIYTSGSTGRPKGVMVTHRNVLRLFDATNHWYEFTDRDVWSLFHSVAFDFSVWEFWGALLHGARLLIVPFATTRSPDDLLDLIAAERVSVLSQTPSAFRQLVAADSARANIAPLALRHVVFGGEALDVNTLRPWFDRRGDEMPRLVNMYGITETTVHTTYRPIRAADLGARVRSPIGVAIPDLHLLVLDAAGEPVPLGVPGELYVGGAGVARGYLNRPELTQSRFLSDPSSTDPSARLYRSGDLVRRLPNDDIEYLGRIDLQIKIRGFRIELGEIDAVLSQHPSVDHCAVVVKSDAGGGATGDPRIIAYIVARPDVDWSVADLQAFVRRSLPDYMVPSAFVRLSALPLTSSHKLDVTALPVPDQVESTSTRVFVPPQTAIEREIAAEWQRILGVERVGADDDFFELGGHSILATGLARWMKQHFLIDFPVYAVFESPTVAGMAERVTALQATSPTSSTPTVASETREEFEL
jgi:amino acid adenylation domain-containing protein